MINCNFRMVLALVTFGVDHGHMSQSPCNLQVYNPNAGEIDGQSNLTARMLNMVSDLLSGPKPLARLISRTAMLTEMGIGHLRHKPGGFSLLPEKATLQELRLGGHRPASSNENDRNAFEIDQNLHRLSARVFFTHPLGTAREMCAT